MSLPYLSKRNRKYQYRRTIPDDLRPFFDGHREFKRSLKTDDLSIAASEYAIVHRECEQRLAVARAAVRSGVTPNSTLSREEALALRSEFGLPAGKIFDPANQTAEEALRLLGPLLNHQNPGPRVRDAVLGKEHVKIRLSEALAEYFNAVAHEETRLNPREIAKKHNPMKRAFQDLVGVLGDRTLFGLERKDAKRFRDALRVEIEMGAINAETANKKLGHISTVLTRLSDESESDFDNPFRGLKFKGSKGKRPPFDHTELEALFAEGNLDGLDPECRAMLWAMADTGCSWKELCQLTGRDIALSDDVPHIRIRESDSGRLKTAHRERTVPLVGLALRAFHEFPNGFPNHFGAKGPENASANANKYLSGHGLLPTSKHTAYSLRHSFKDRLREADIPQEAQDKLMGQKSAGIGAHYGRSYGLSELQKYMNRIRPIQRKNRNK